MTNSQGRRIINSCQTCRTPIYEGEPIYTSSKGQSSGHTRGVMEVEALEIIKLEGMEEVIVEFMLPRVGLNVLGVMTNDKPKSLPIRVFESNGGWEEFY